jgi:hypothetical protein
MAPVLDVTGDRTDAGYIQSVGFDVREHRH